MINLVKKSAAVLVLSLSFTSAFANEAMTSAHADALNTACASEGQAAGCGDKKAGSGLGKCIHAYKKAHKDFKISEGCHHAMKEAHADMSK